MRLHVPNPPPTVAPPAGPAPGAAGAGLPWAPVLAPGSAPWAGVIAVGLALTLAWLLGRGLWRTMPMRRATRERARHAAPLVRATIALGYTLWALGVLLSPHPRVAALAQGGLLVASLAAAWPMLRDVVAGLVLRGSGACSLGDTIRVGDIEGRVRAMGLRTMLVQTATGEQALVPYRAVTRDVVVRTPTDEAAAHTFRAALPAGLSPAQAQARVERAVTESHWAALSRPPRVRPAGADSLEITVFALSPAHAVEVERAARAALASDAPSP